MKKIFISHSVQDEEIAAAFIELFHAGMDIRKSDIFCSSKYESLEIGTDFVDEIRRALEESEVVIALLSPSYMDSLFCHIEWGASWVSDKKVKPVVIPPLTFSQLGKPVGDKQAMMVNDKQRLAQLYEELRDLKLAGKGLDDFVTQREVFLNKMEKLLEARERKTQQLRAPQGSLSPQSVPASEGIVEARITEVYRKEGLEFLKLDKRIGLQLLRQLKETRALEEQEWEREQHWLDNRYYKIRGAAEGMKVAFKVTGSKYYEHIDHGPEHLYDVRNIYFNPIF